MMTFTICIKTSTLTKTTHYTGYQQKLFDEIKRLKEVEGYGYKRISYILYGKKIEKVKSDEVNDLYKWIRLLEEDFDGFFNLEIDSDINQS